jgi:predicted RNA binding protein YcfA (HicA-like mRNA interferase family)
MPLSYKQITSILNDLWFKKVRSKWSHFRYELNNKWLTVAFHKEYPPKTAKSMLQDISNISGINYIDLIKRYNIKL